MLVEDDLLTQKYLKQLLVALNISEIDCFNSAKAVLSNFSSNKYDLILMDISLTGSIDGIQLSKKLLEIIHLPIVFITAFNKNNELFDEILTVSPYGLIHKPFTLAELKNTLSLAYSRYLNETSKKDKISSTEYIKINNKYKYLQEDKELYKDNENIKLNYKQQLLLHLLIENMNRYVSVDQLIHTIWVEKPMADSSLRTLVYSLRKALPDLPLISYSKIGYMLKSIDNTNPTENLNRS